jgi:hypothetical protein
MPRALAIAIAWGVSSFAVRWAIFAMSAKCHKETLLKAEALCPNELLQLVKRDQLVNLGMERGQHDSSLVNHMTLYQSDGSAAP